MAMDVNNDTKKPIAAYKAAIDAYGTKAEGTVSIYEDSLVWDTLFRQDALSYADIKSFSGGVSGVELSDDRGLVRFTGMGREAPWFFEELYSAYNVRVRSAFNIDAAPEQSFKARVDGDLRAENARLELYRDCLCVLPPDINGRCLPFPLITDMRRDGFALTLSLPGESYSFSMLGRELEPLERVLTEHIRSVRETGAAFIEKLCPALGFAGSARAACLLSEGVAAPMASLPSALQACLAEKLKNSKSGPYLPELGALGDTDRMWVGVRRLSESTVSELRSALAESLQDEELSAAQEDALRWQLWAAVPGKDGGSVIVEFALPDEAAATYVFSLTGSFEDFMARLNLGLWLSRLERSSLSLPEVELALPENESRRMLLERSGALLELRRSFLGRSSHSSPQSWRKGIEKLLIPPANIPADCQRFCTQCGAKLSAGLRFCTGCGAKL